MAASHSHWSECPHGPDSWFGGGFLVEPLLKTVSPLLLAEQSVKMPDQLDNSLALEPRLANAAKEPVSGLSTQDYDLKHCEQPTELKHITWWWKCRQQRLLQ